MITLSDDFFMMTMFVPIVLDHIRDDFTLQYEQPGAKSDWFMHDNTKPHYAPSHIWFGESFTNRWGQ
jgi:hypothetical protein